MTKDERDGTPRAAAGKRVALYLRVSTDGQDCENQERELRQVAERHGWDVVEKFEDKGVSGAKGRNKRPGYETRRWSKLAEWMA